MADKKGKKRFILSTSGLNSYGFRILTEGADLSQFKKNPVMLFNHDRWSNNYNGPVGRWTGLKVDGDEISAEADFDLNDPKADALADKVDGGYLNGASFGIKIIEWSEDPELMLPGQTLPTATKWKAVEASVCDIPSNDDSLALYDSDDKLIDLSLGMPTNLFTPLNVSKTKRNMEINLSHIAVFVGLKATAKESDIMEAIDVVMKDNKTLTDTNRQLTLDKKKLDEQLQEANGKLAELSKGDNEAYVDLCIRDKKINAEDREYWLQNLNERPVETRAHLDKKKGAVNLGQQIIETEQPEGEDRSKWTLNDYRQKDPKALALMQKNEPEKFKKLYEDLEEASKKD